jgi:hypothetical protein
MSPDGGRFYNHILLVKYLSKRHISPILHLFLGFPCFNGQSRSKICVKRAKTTPHKEPRIRAVYDMSGKDRDVVCSCDIQGRKHDFLRVTCFNEQAKLLLNDNHPLVLCALQDSAMLPLSEEETIRLATCNWELHFCTVVTLLVQRSMKLKKKGRFVNFVEYV